MADLAPLRRALISVSDKTGLLGLVRVLASRGVEILSTGGTAREIRDAGHQAVDVSDVTGFPEMMDGRVKTLHPKVHGGLLASRENPGHVAEMEKHGIPCIDLLVANLYPFEAAVAAGETHDRCIENIDIGGPAMIRSAAKNHAHVAVVVDPADYPELIAELESRDGETSLGFRRKLAMSAFGRTAAYDAAVSGWMASSQGEAAPRRRVISGELSSPLRYGENPHQRAAFYRSGERRPGVATAMQHQGKELSYNNINDADAAFELVSEFDPSDGPVCAIVKHANPCGVARGENPAEAYRRAFDCDRISAFGGIVALNRLVDGATAERIAENFAEVVIAPGADDESLRVFSTKKNLRLLTTGDLADPAEPGLSIRQVGGGFLAQDRDCGRIATADFRPVTKRAPTRQESADLKFAWTVAKHVKSNAIVYAKDGATVGVGAGQSSRIDSSRIAARKAEDMAETLNLDASPAMGSVVASDAFFPFPDALMAAVEAGATAAIQPGGSIRDEEVIAEADKAGLAMIFVGMRHFRH